MINKQNILKMVRSVTRKSKGIPDRRLMHPKREWGIAVILGFVCLGSGLVFAVWQFQTYETISVDTSEINLPGLRYQRLTALEVIEVYENKQSTLDALVQANPPVPVESKREEDAKQTEETELQTNSSTSGTELPPSSSETQGVPTSR